MKTTLYDTNEQQRVGKFRNGPYLVDGKPGPLPDNIVELTVVEIREPINQDTQTYNRREEVDLNTLEYKIIYYPVDQQIIDFVPTEVWDRSLRLALIDYGISMSDVEATIEAVPDAIEKEKVRIYWEYTQRFQRNHSLLNQFAESLGLTQDQIDQIFINAESL